MLLYRFTKQLSRAQEMKQLLVRLLIHMSNQSAFDQLLFIVTYPLFSAVRYPCIFVLNRRPLFDGSDLESWDQINVGLSTHHSKNHISDCNTFHLRTCAAEFTTTATLRTFYQLLFGLLTYQYFIVQLTFRQPFSFYSRLLRLYDDYQQCFCFIYHFL